MLKSKGIIKPEELFEIVIKRRWFIIIPFCLSIIIGSYLAITLPKIYSAKTLILIQPQGVPDEYVQSIVSTDIDSRIRNISQQVLSRTNLEKIIEDFSLFKGPKYENMYVEDKIKSLRKRISVDVIRRSRNVDAFSISFKGEDPENVMKITNALSSYYIDANIKVRETQAVGTSDFLDSELNTIREELVRQEEKLKKYREKNMGGLPEQLESNLRMLDRLQEQSSARQASLAEAKNRLAVFENQISETRGLRGEGAGVTSDGPTGSESQAFLDLGQAKARLAYLENRYTEKHPDVIRFKKIISDLEKNKPSGELQSVPLESRMRMEEIKSEIRTCKADISKLAAQVQIYQQRVEDTPKREQEFLSIKRDYDNIKETYGSLLDRKLEAEISVNMEKKQKGEQFRILDPAKLPGKPISPDMKKLFLFTLAAGLGFGGGLIFLLDFLDTSFRSPEDIESLLGISVLATYPIIYHPEDIRKQKFNNFLSAFFIMMSFVLFAGFAIITFKGVDWTMKLVGRFITI